jgi:hypothetical protein
MWDRNLNNIVCRVAGKQSGLRGGREGRVVMSQMRSAMVTMLVEYFNNAAVVILAIFAIFGIIVIFRRKIWRIDTFGGKSAKRAKVETNGGYTFLSVFCVAALVAFALEATIFNYWHYLKYFSGPATAISGISGADRNILTTTDGTPAELIENGTKMHFKNLNRRVTSVFANVDFKDIDVADMFIEWTDENMTQRYSRKIYKYPPHERYVPIQSCGKVSGLTVTFSNRESVKIIGIEINKPIPYYFSGLRLLVVSFVGFAFFALVNRNLRAKAAYYLFECKFDPKNKKQNIVYICTVALLILYSWICVYTSVANRHENNMRFSQYNQFLVDALIAGRTYLEYGHPEILLNAERPYDNGWREAHVYKNTTNQEAFDWAWYKGKYYCYFGVVPAVLLYVPYKLITGNYLSNHIGVFLFCAVAVILLAILWRYCVKKYMRDTRYALYLLSFLTLFFASGFFALLRYPTFYCIVQSAGFMFTVAGILLLLKSVDNEKINHLKLFFACLCFALVFGCRPNLGLASLLVPVVLWKYRTWKLFAFAAIPYIIVAIPLCLYNYVRFESIFEFGTSYMLTAFNMGTVAQQNVLGKIYKVFISLAHYLFCPVQILIYFPFVTTQQVDTVHIISGIAWFYRSAIGVINFPIVFLLFQMIGSVFNKNKPKIFYMLYASLIIAVAIVVLNSIVVGCQERYLFDIATFIILPSLFCAYYWCHGRSNGEVSTTQLISFTARLGITYALMAVSVFVGLFLAVGVESTHSYWSLFRYLQYSLDFVGVR